MRFRDRADAAGKLAAALRAYRGKNPLVLAIPRGAVPMGRVLAAHHRPLVAHIRNEGDRMEAALAEMCEPFFGVDA